MRKKVRIYAEGTNDIVFLKNYMEAILGFQIDVQGKTNTFENATVQGSFINIQGWSKVNTSYWQAEVQNNDLSGIQTLLILDADNEHNGGGFAIRKTAVETIKSNLPFEYFLIPNHEEDGYLETLLGKIIVEEYQTALQCLKDQDQCLASANKNILTGKKIKVAPAKSADKAVVHSFMSRLENKGKNRFKDNTIWNLQHPYLTPLQQFLQTHLQEVL